MISSPNLDDRSYEDIVQEAIRLIPQYCPEWTNFNKSDPGITLIELFAWMTEMVIYRLNKVPDKNFLEFLNLMGIRRQPAQPARTILTFTCNEKVDSTVVKTGTRVATRPTGDRKATTFETENDLLVTNNRIGRCVSQYHDQFSDHTDALDTGRTFPIFEGVRTVDRYLYVGDDRFENFTEAAVLTLGFNRPNPGERPFPKMMEWEYWNGDRWRELRTSSMETGFDEIAFVGPDVIAPTEIHEITSFWIRGRLVDVPDSHDETTVDTISGRIEVLGHGVRPDQIYYNPQGEAFLLLDLDRNFLPFGAEPSTDNFLYLASDEVLCQHDTVVKVEIGLSDQIVAEKPEASNDLILEWQYFNGKRWRPLGRTGPGTTAGKATVTKNPHNFEDHTDAFTRSGMFSFSRPGDMRPSDVNGKEHFWIRARIIKGSYGEKGSYELVDDQWIYRDEFPLRPPSLQSITMRFSEASIAFAHILTYNDFLFSNQSKLAATEYKPFATFLPVPEENPTIYFGLDDKLPNENMQIYVGVVDAENAAGRPKHKVFAGDSIQDRYTQQSVVWEYWAGKEWALLFPKDGSKNFTGSGFVQFLGPKNHRKSRRYGDNLYWIRARLEMGGYDEPPICDRVLLNTVYASNYTSFRETILGSSQGTPNQSFWFNRGPVLPGQQIIVRETERPHDDDIQTIVYEEGEGAFADAPNGDGYQVQWHRVDSLYESGPKSRHYIKDVTSGELAFGDGVRGMIPPKGERNIVARLYRVGGGIEGNVPTGSVSVLKQTLSHIVDVTNHYPAQGGAGLEDIEDLKLRGPYSLKSRGRAVTQEDFEWLAVQSSSSVSRINCIPRHPSEGQVTIVVVPKVAPDHPDFMKKAVPSTELLRRVEAYLDERKLLTTILHVVKPRYRELSTRIEIMRRSSGSADRIKRDIEERLRMFTHPLRGGRDGRGWPFGRNVFKVDLYHIVEGVEFVSNIRITDEDAKIDVEQVFIQDDELPFLVNVDVTEKAHEMVI
jgi:hypothetical protein